MQKKVIFNFFIIDTFQYRVCWGLTNSVIQWGGTLMLFTRLACFTLKLIGLISTCDWDRFSTALLWASLANIRTNCWNQIFIDAWNNIALLKRSTRSIAPITFKPIRCNSFFGACFSGQVMERWLTRVVCLWLSWLFLFWALFSHLLVRLENFKMINCVSSEANVKPAKNEKQGTRSQAYGKHSLDLTRLGFRVAFKFAFGTQCANLLALLFTSIFHCPLYLLSFWLFSMLLLFGRGGCWDLPFSWMAFAKFPSWQYILAKPVLRFDVVLTICIQIELNRVSL